MRVAPVQRADLCPARESLVAMDDGRPGFLRVSRINAVLTPVRFTQPSRGLMPPYSSSIGSWCSRSVRRPTRMHTGIRPNDDPRQIASFRCISVESGGSRNDGFRGLLAGHRHGTVGATLRGGIGCGRGTRNRRRGRRRPVRPPAGEPASGRRAATERDREI